MSGPLVFNDRIEVRHAHAAKLLTREHPSTHLTYLADVKCSYMWALRRVLAAKASCFFAVWYVLSNPICFSDRLHIDVN
jgi:hypothetical protein